MVVGADGCVYDVGNFVSDDAVNFVSNDADCFVYNAVGNVASDDVENYFI